MSNSTSQQFNSSTSKDVLIKAEHISKKYCRYLKDSMVYGLSDIGRNAFGFSSRSDRLRKNEFWSVDDISFEVKRGETLGLVGANGSGKTTTLKMLNGIFWPDKGKITVRGRVGALIAVGAGFHPLLTGRENIYINGAILGMSKSEVDRNFDSIVDFAGIGDFIDSPIKHYSSGMYVRLGFAVAVHANCDILLIDEILAVGDANFQARCVDKIMEKAKQGVAIIFISHNLDSVKMLCKNCLYLSKGKVVEYGQTEQVLNVLRKDFVDGRTAGIASARRGNGDIEIGEVKAFDRSNNPKKIFKRGEWVCFKIPYFAKTAVKDPNFSIGVCSESGLLLEEAVTQGKNFKTGEVRGHGEIVFTLPMLPLPAGKYWLSVGCWDSTGNTPYDYREKVHPLVVVENDDMLPSWKIVKGNQV